MEDSRLDFSSAPFRVTFDKKTKNVIASLGQADVLCAIECKTRNILGYMGDQHSVNTVCGGWPYTHDDKSKMFDAPGGLCMQPGTNNMIVCEEGRHTVQIVDGGNKSICTIGKPGNKSAIDGSFNMPSGVTCAPNGNFSVSETFNCRVQQFDPSGRFLSKFGKRGIGKGQLFGPGDLAMLDSRFSGSSSLLLITEWNNHRLSVWSADGSQHVLDAELPIGAEALCVDTRGLVYVGAGTSGIITLDPRKGFAMLDPKTGMKEKKNKFETIHAQGLCVDETTNTLVASEPGENCIHFLSLN